MTLISASILSADFMNLGQEIRNVDQAGADFIHFDIMDGQFVPNLTMGPNIVKAAKMVSQKPFDVHLMINDPERYIETFSNAGADYITIHIEASRHIQRTLAQIRALGKKAGVSLNPSTSEDTIRYILADLDLVLIMTVNPGFSGQKFLDSQLQKIISVKQMLTRSNNTTCKIAVDGGIDKHSAPRVIKAGADILVCGNAIFGSGNYKKGIKDLVI